VPVVLVVPVAVGVAVAVLVGVAVAVVTPTGVAVAVGVFLVFPGAVWACAGGAVQIADGTLNATTASTNPNRMSTYDIVSSCRSRGVPVGVALWL
jgi:hypothetical protein